jgi:hypothetical protein
MSKPSSHDFKDEVARNFKRVLLELIPKLRLGGIDFEGRENYADFSYAGNGKFPVGLSPRLSFVESATNLSWSQKQKQIRVEFDSRMMSYLTRVTFHELGHATALSMEGQPQRIRLMNYGFESPESFSQYPKRIRMLGLTKEIEALAVWCALNKHAGLQDDLATLEGVIHVVNRFPWVGLLSVQRKRQTFLAMYHRCSRLGAVNRALDRLNQNLPTLRSK